MSSTTTSGQVSRARAHGLAAVRRLADHADVRLGVQQQPQALAHDVVILGQQNSNRTHPVPPSSGNQSVTRVPPGSRRVTSRLPAQRVGPLLHPQDARTPAARPARRAPRPASPTPSSSIVIVSPLAVLLHADPHLARAWHAGSCW